MKVEVDCSVWTLQRHLKQKGYRYKKKIQKPKAQRRHIWQLLADAKKYQKWGIFKWNQFLFFDEKTFSFDGPDGFKMYWHDKNMPPETLAAKHSGGTV